MLSSIWPFATPWTACRPPGSSVHGILQAGMLEWVPIPFSRRSSQPRNQAQVSRLAGGQVPYRLSQLACPSIFIWENASLKNAAIPGKFSAISAGWRIFTIPGFICLILFCWNVHIFCPDILSGASLFRRPFVSRCIYKANWNGLSPHMTLLNSSLHFVPLSFRL